MCILATLAIENGHQNEAGQASSSLLLATVWTVRVQSSRGLGQCRIVLDKSLCELPTASAADNDEEPARLAQAALRPCPACWLASALSSF